MGYIVKPATFNGKHNKVKSKCFIILYLAHIYCSENELRLACGEEPNCWHWHDCLYLIRRMRSGKYVPFYIYALTLRGKRFVTDRIPPEKYEEYLAEIKAHQAKLKAENPNIKFVVTLI